MSSVLPSPNISLSALCLRAALIVASIAILTCSFDIFLVVQVGGTFRLCQLLTLTLLPLALLQARWKGAVPVLGLYSILLWWFVQALFIPVSSFWPKSAGYVFWLALNIALLFSFVQLFSRRQKDVTALMRCYLWSFNLIAVFGIMQFVLPLLGIDAPLVEQWWLKGRLARVNGFSYEPSYFATYLLIGFVLAGALRGSPGYSRLATLTRYLSGTGIVLSSSRMGIVFMLLDVLAHQYRPFARVCRDLFRLRVAPARVLRLLPSIFVLLVLASVGAAFAWVLQTAPQAALLFLNGTGLGDTASHSADQRSDALSDTLTLFVRDPFVGQSLGGISSGIAELHGFSVRSFEDGKLTEGMSVFAEALAASGIIGVLPFAAFVWSTFWSPLRRARSVCSEYAWLLRALVRALVFLWAILQFNQNILRPYVWVHLAILATVYAASRRAIEVSERPIAQIGPPLPGSSEEKTVPSTPPALPGPPIPVAGCPS